MLRAVKKPFSTKATRIGSTRWVESQLDDLTRRILHLTESSCFTCGSTKELQVGHLFERRHRHTRWDVDEKGNNHLQCPNCNARHEAFPEKYRNTFTTRFGERAYSELAERAHSNQKITFTDLVAQMEEMQTRLDKLRGKAA